MNMPLFSEQCGAFLIFFHSVLTDSDIHNIQVHKLGTQSYCQIGK